MRGNKNHIATFFTGLVAGALTFGYLGYAIAWSNPPASPPNSNVSAPLNIGASSQSKSGALSIVNLLDVNSLSVWGDTILSGTNNYLNFGTVPGSSGYGIRNNAGTMEFKNTGGVWASLNSVIQSYLSAGAVTQVKFVDGTTQTTAAGAGVLSCPNGFSMVGIAGQRNTFCVETNERAAATFWEANSICANLTTDLGFGHVCSSNEFLTVCSKAVGNDLSDDYEWISDWSANNTNTRVATLQCPNANGRDVSMGYNPYRCCL